MFSINWILIYSFVFKAIQYITIKLITQITEIARYVEWKYVEYIKK